VRVILLYKRGEGCLMWGWDQLGISYLCTYTVPRA